ncbi:MAG TPA: acyltransferase domain-containing protein, partial [Pseudonocardiaceae bacterium]|nr:acyltransferase domain-containing protein [Pseudonocardiaceae bacterium]
MASIPLPEIQVTDRVSGVEGVSVAAVNGPRSVVIAGEPDAVQGIVDGYVAGDVRARMIAVDYASHSAHVESLHEELLEVLAGIEPAAPAIPMLSTLTGEWVQAGELDAEYWFANLRNRVGFHSAVTRLLDERYRAFVEVSPHPVLTIGVQETIDDTDLTAVVTGTLRRDEDGLDRVLTSLAEAFVRGVAVDWKALFAGTGARRVDLPTYAFQHEEFWPEAALSVVGNVAAAGLAAAGHPLLGAAVGLAGAQGTLLTGRLSLRSHQWLADHVVGGVVLFPGTGFLELAIRAGDQVGCDRVDELTLTAPLVLAEDAATVVQVSISGPDDSARRTVDIYARSADAAEDEPWVQHATGVLAVGERTADWTDAATWPPADATPVEAEGGYARLAAGGLEYGPIFQGLRAVWQRGDEVFAEIALPEQAVGDADSFGLHPALLDAALHAVPFVGLDEADGVRLPFSWGGVCLHARGASTLRVRLVKTGSESVSVSAVDVTGEPVLSADSLTLRAVSTGQLAASSGSTMRDSLFRLEWTMLPEVAQGVDGESDVVELVGDLSSLEQIPALVAVTVGSTEADAGPAAVHELTGRVL